MNVALRFDRARVATWLSASILAACTRREPPSPSAIPSVALPELDPTPAATSATAVALAAGPPAASPSSSAASTAGSTNDAAAQPQTRDAPHASGAAFDERARALWDAIEKDDPDRAMSFFFPLAAYQQVKDVANPASDWKHRLVAAYARDIHTLHRVIVDAGGQPRLLGLDVPDGRARWVEPGEEYNKIGYFRVFGSKLRYELDGAPHALDVKSLISWRGEWYVVHLSSIK
jgi:hypothetical protein